VASRVGPPCSTISVIQNVFIIHTPGVTLSGRYAAHRKELIPRRCGQVDDESSRRVRAERELDNTRLELAQRDLDLLKANTSLSGAVSLHDHSPSTTAEASRA
jgi:hypothetical protein